MEDNSIKNLITAFVALGIIAGVLTLMVSTASANTAQTTVQVGVVDEISSSGVHATVLCTNDNWEHSERCTAIMDVNTLTLTEKGFEGALLSGVRYEQTKLIAGLHKFTMEEVYWYIDKHGTFHAENDFQAFAIYLTRIW